MSIPKLPLRALTCAASLFAATACADLTPLPRDPLAPRFSIAACGTPPCNLALNPSRSGYPSPLESDPGWGGGTDTWDIVDGQNYYAWWAEGLALNYGGRRQVTIDLGSVQRFDSVVVWHHIDCCVTGNNVPASVTLEYFDGAWHPIGFSRSYDLSYAAPGGTYGSYPDSYRFAAVNGSKVRWSYDGSGANVLGGTGNWHGWVYEMEVFGGPPATDYAINLTTFIPGNSISAPTPWIKGSAVLFPCFHKGGIYFAGDTRGFDPGSPSFRTRQTVTVVPDASLDADGVKDGVPVANQTGITRAYAANALPILDDADNDGVLYDCSLLHAVGQASNAAMSVVTTRTGPSSVRVHLTGSAADPLIPVVAPSVDWDLTLDLDQATGHWSLSGLEDGFPAFEMYINGMPIYQRNAPPPYGNGDLKKLLDGHGDVTVSASGTLP